MKPIRSCDRVRAGGGRGQAALRAAAAAALLGLGAASSPAQSPAPVPTTAAEEARPAPAPPIADNSFLIEEAYNQERGVVQHINTFARQRGGGWAYSFTQEWPLPGQRHQLSATLPVDRATSPEGSRTGIGDVALNYRWQALGMDGARVALSPRLTLLAPTGGYERRLG